MNGTDKNGLFAVERSSLSHAPLIGSCPVSMEMKLAQTVQLGAHEVFIGELVDTSINETCLTGGKPDLVKIDPLLFDFMKLDYWSGRECTKKP